MEPDWVSSSHPLQVESRLKMLFCSLPGTHCLKIGVLSLSMGLSYMKTYMDTMYLGVRPVCPLAPFPSLSLPINRLCCCQQFCFYMAKDKHGAWTSPPCPHLQCIFRVKQDQVFLVCQSNSLPCKVESVATPLASVSNIRSSWTSYRVMAASLSP